MYVHRKLLAILNNFVVIFLILWLWKYKFYHKKIRFWQFFGWLIDFYGNFNTFRSYLDVNNFTEYLTSRQETIYLFDMISESAMS
jgi:hypothetical protein